MAICKTHAEWWSTQWPYKSLAETAAAGLN